VLDEAVVRLDAPPPALAHVHLDRIRHPFSIYGALLNESFTMLKKKM
jgi:hypothetical protein